LGEGSAPVGEWAFPLLVMLGSAAMGVVLLLRRDAPREDATASTASLLRVTFGLVAFVALLTVAGFVAAGTTLFAFAASAFGSRRWLRDALVGFTLCATVYITFTFGLGVQLPAGALLNGR